MEGTIDYMLDAEKLNMPRPKCHYLDCNLLYVHQKLMCCSCGLYRMSVFYGDKQKQCHFIQILLLTEHFVSRMTTLHQSKCGVIVDEDNVNVAKQLCYVIFFLENCFT